MSGAGRNDPCPCGSGRKHKNCCLAGAGSGGSILSSEARKIEALLAGAGEADREGDGSRACGLWAEAWSLARTRLGPGVRSCGDVPELDLGRHLLFNWIQDYAMALQNAALEDVRFARSGVAFCAEVLAAFPDEDGHFTENFRGDLGVFHFLAGSPDEGERVLRDLIRDLPHRSIGYAFLSDMLGESGRPWSPSGPLDIAAAAALLEEALARPVEDAEDYDLEFRLDSLRRDWR